MRIAIEDVPDVSVGWYRDVVGFAHATPSWLQHLVKIGTDAIPMLLAALFAVLWWRAWRGEDRGGDDRTKALALLAPVATVLAYLSSEVLKTLLQMPRPCWQPGHPAIIATCPPAGDWSFPSNHATFAAAAATALVLAWRQMVFLAPALAVLAAASRVFVGVHYPHDVAAGFLLGVAVASLVMGALLTPAILLAARLTPTRRPGRHRRR